MSKQNFKGITCPEKNASFSDNNKHHTALASFPGAGNTWTRHLLEYISGVHTGGIYFDPALAKEFRAERHTERVIAIKTHAGCGDHDINYDNVVLLIRRPEDCVLSLFNWEKTRSHTATAKPELFNTNALRVDLEKNLKSWREFYLSWLTNYKARMMVLSYSRLQQDFFNELYKLGDFLNVSVAYKSLWCAFERKEGRFHRRSNLDRNKVFTKDVRDKIRMARDDVENALRRVFGDEAQGAL